MQYALLLHQNSTILSDRGSPACNNVQTAWAALAGLTVSWAMRARKGERAVPSDTGDMAGGEEPGGGDAPRAMSSGSKLRSDQAPPPASQGQARRGRQCLRQCPGTKTMV